MRVAAILLFLIFFSTSVVAYADGLLTCRSIDTIMSMSVNVTNDDVSFVVSDPLQLCDSWIMNSTIYVLCMNVSLNYPVSIVVKNADIITVAVSGADCVTQLIQPLENTTHEIEEYSKQLVENMTSPSYLSYLVELVPGGKTTFALMIDVFAFMATTSPAILAASVLLTSPLLPAGLAYPAVALSIGYLLFRAWQRMRG